MSLAALCRPTPRTRVSADNNLTPEYTFMDTNCIFMHIYVSVRMSVCVCVCVCVCASVHIVHISCICDLHMRADLLYLHTLYIYRQNV